MLANIMMVGSIIFVAVIGMLIAKKMNILVKQDRQKRIDNDGL